MEEVFRVSVSLERFFSDSRARCYMSAERARPARWLARRLRRAFRLPRPLALLCRGHLLPPDEPLALLRPDDPLEVIPIHPSEQVTYRKKFNGDKTCPMSEDFSSPHHTADEALDERDGAVAEPCRFSAEPRQSFAEPSRSPAAPSSGRDETGAGAGSATQSSDAEAAEAELEAGKLRALRLLSELAPERAPRRRRVRRRRRAPAPAANPAPAPASDEHPDMEAAGAGTEPAAAAAVVRAAGPARAPRVVRALPAPVPAPAAVLS